MISVYSKKQILALEQKAFECGFSVATLMHRAGEAVVRFLKIQCVDALRYVVCTGSGNNAGDGYVVAQLLHEQGYSVSVCAVVPTSELQGAAREAALACQASGVSISTHETSFDAVDVVVDALFGIGVHGAIEEPYASLIHRINDCNAYVVSVDIPSGLNADTGRTEGAVVDADATITFIAYKMGLFTLKGPGRSGMLVLDTLMLPSAVYAQATPVAHIIDPFVIRRTLTRRDRDTHKGECGHVLIIGGDYGMGGAVRMSAEGALRVGAGLVSVATRPEHVCVVGSARPEIMCHQIDEPHQILPLLDRANVVVIGPGLGKTTWAEGLLRLVLASQKPKLLDADALTLLSHSPIHADNWILTPHPGEGARLLHTSCQEVQADRFESVRAIQALYGGVAVLKGAGTLIKGSEDSIRVCTAGNPGMASGGMGDVLSGVIGGFIAQGIDLYRAAELGVYVHARAADLAVSSGGGERGLLATDLLPHLRNLVNPHDDTKTSL